MNQFFIVSVNEATRQSSFYNQLFDSYSAAYQKIKEYTNSFFSVNSVFMILPYIKNKYYNFTHPYNTWLSFNHYFKGGE